MKREPLSKTIEKIEWAMTRLRARISNYQGETNPQIIEMKLKAQGELEALEAVHNALKKGDNVYLNIMAGM